MLSAATTVDGQGVGSAYIEQVALVKELDDIYEVSENSKSKKFHIQHMHTFNPKYVFRLDKKHLNVAYVHCIPTTFDGSLKFPKPIFWIFKKWVIHSYRKADELVVVNPSFIEPLVELGIKRENVAYIPNFVDHTKFNKISDERRLEVRNKYGINKDQFVVLGCGQVQTRKGVKDFVATAIKNPDKTFVWAGGFSFGKITDGYKELKAIMENPPENVKFIGIVPRNEMNDIFNMSDILFMPSLSELFPMSILEAVNSNKPVLLRDLDLYEEILFKDKDCYAVGTNVEEFDSQVKKLASDESYYEHYSNGSKVISDFYSKEHVKNIWKEYYVRVYEKWKDNPKKRLLMEKRKKEK